VFKYGNGWIQRHLHSGELIGVKKKEKGKEKGKEAMLGVKEKKMGAGAGGNGKRRELLGRWRGGGSQLVRQQVH